MLMTKKYCLTAGQLRPLYPESAGGGMVTDRIAVEGLPVRFMFREKPVDEADSGWTFCSGIHETDAYMNDPRNHSVMSLNTIANMDPSIIPYLDAPFGSAFEKMDETFETVEDWENEQE